MLLGKIISRVLFGVFMTAEVGSVMSSEGFYDGIRPQPQFTGTIQTFLETPSYLGSSYGTNTGLTLMVGGAALCLLGEQYLKHKSPSVQVKCFTIPVRSISTVSGALAMTAGVGCLYLSQETSMQLKYGLPVTVLPVALVAALIYKGTINIPDFSLEHEALGETVRDHPVLAAGTTIIAGSFLIGSLYMGYKYFG